MTNNAGLRPIGTQSRLVLASLVLLTACGGARTVGPEWSSRVETVTVSEVEPADAPRLARRFFEEVSVQMLSARGYRPPEGEEQPDAHLRVLIEDWEADEQGMARVRALFVLVGANTGEMLWSVSTAEEAHARPRLRPSAELLVRRPPWELAVERATRTALHRLPAGPAWSGEGG